MHFASLAQLTTSTQKQDHITLYGRAKPLTPLEKALPSSESAMESLPIVLGVIVAIIFLIGLAALINIAMRRQGPVGSNYV